MKKTMILMSGILIALSISCKEPASSDANAFKNLSQTAIDLQSILAGPVGQRLQNPELCRADIDANAKLYVLGQSRPGLEGNAEASCKSVGGRVMCEQQGHTTTGLGFELPKGGIDLGQQAFTSCYFLGRVFGVKGDKRPAGFKDASYSVHKVKVARSIRSFSETTDAYLFKINTQNKLDKTARTSDIYIGVDGKILGASYTENPGMNYNQNGAKEQPYAEYQIAHQ